VKKSLIYKKEVQLPPSRRRSLSDAARDPLTHKMKSGRRNAPPTPTDIQKGLPVLVKVALGMFIGFAGGFVLGRFNRWI
jgi:hypothetical protein